MRPWELQACGKSGPRCQCCGIGEGKGGAWMPESWGLGWEPGFLVLSGEKRGLRPRLLGSGQGRC